MASVRPFSEDEQSDDEGYNLILTMLTGEEEDEGKMTFAELLFLQRVADNMGFGEAARSLKLYRLIQRTMELHPGVQTPTMELLASTWVDMLECFCLEDSDVPESLFLDLATHCFRTVGLFPHCGLLLSIYEFRVQQQGRNPTADELIAMVAARAEMERDPEAYWAKTRQQVATPNLDDLLVVTTKAIEACPLCQEDIAKGSKCFQMPCCKQYYHCDAKSCLGESTVVKWLGGSRKCPGCGQDVVIAAPKKKRKRAQKAEEAEYNYEKSATRY